MAKQVNEKIGVKFLTLPDESGDIMFIGIYKELRVMLTLNKFNKIEAIGNPPEEYYEYSHKAVFMENLDYILYKNVIVELKKTLENELESTSIIFKKTKKDSRASLLYLIDGITKIIKFLNDKEKELYEV